MDDAVMKSCWICNVAAAPKELDVEGVKQGIAPAMSKEYILHDIGGMELDAESLKIVWFEEGNAGLCTMYGGDSEFIVGGSYYGRRVPVCDGTRY